MLSLIELFRCYRPCVIIFIIQVISNNIKLIYVVSTNNLFSLPSKLLHQILLPVVK